MKLSALSRCTVAVLFALVLSEGRPAPRSVWAQAVTARGRPETSCVVRRYLPFSLRSMRVGWLAVTPGPAQQIPRLWHTATRLLDGRVMVVGGSRAALEFLAGAEIFDPVTGQTRPVAPLHTPRHQHTATLLRDGRVLVVGGYNLGEAWVPDAEVYDPVANTWAVVPPRNSFGVSHTATLMKDGRVLLVGGAIGDSRLSTAAEIFDPQADSWIEAAALGSVRASHTAQLLEDGRVLVAGGFGYGDVSPTDGDALVYDPRTDRWRATGPMVQPRIFGESVRLPDGRVLVAGGATPPGESIPGISTSAEIYDPLSNVWTAAAPLARPRYFYELVLLPGGQALAVGGARDWECCWSETSFVREIERYDPATDAWRIVGEIPQPTVSAAAALLPDERVWVTGGATESMFCSDTWLIGS